MLYYSPFIKEVLNKIEDNKISESLLALEGRRNDFTFIDCDRGDDQLITFVRLRDAVKILDRNNISKGLLNKSQISTIDSNWDSFRSMTDGSKNSIKIGKFIKTIGHFTNSEVENFINLFKSTKATLAGLEFELVQGSKIAEWYSATKYLGGKWSQLHASCMANSPSETFDIYVKNPDVCSMLILKKSNKLVGRAIVWKLKDPINGCDFFMDRIYTIEDYQRNSFIDYAISNNWCYRGSDNWNCPVIINRKRTDKVDIKVAISNSKHKKYPFMDTLKGLDRGILINAYDEKGFGILLNGTDGSYKKCTPSLKNRLLRILGIR